jgi:peptidoglycan/LPS O-acetylase OafA/YrhL
MTATAQASPAPAGFAARIAAATPDGRDRVVDGLRAFAMLGVVLGHWLVSGLALDQAGALRQASPLRVVPGLAGVSWLLETLGLFFFVAGYAAARSFTPARSTAWLARRLARLLPPVLVFLAGWVPVLGLLAVAGLPWRTRWTVGKLAISPLWFLAVLVGLTLATPAALAAVRRFGAWSALGPLAVVATVDVLRYAAWPAAPAALGWLNVPAGWLVPYLLGAALARGGLRSRWAGPALLGIGLAGALALVLAAGYPVSMVGVPGQGRSNLDPPSLAVVAVAVAQVGAARCLWGPLTRLLRRPVLWAGVALVNLTLFTVFLWHQSALLLVVGVTGALTGPLPGLVDRPTGAGWIADRLLWLPVFAAVLAALCALFRPVERLRWRRNASAADS